MCPLCKSENPKVLFRLDRRTSGDRFSLARCATCDLAWLDPLPDVKEIPSFYPKEYWGQGGKQRFGTLLERLIYLSRKRRANRIARLKQPSPGRILDIGCGRGWMLKTLKDLGWDVTGLELSEDSARFARKTLGLKVYTNGLEQQTFPAGCFDVVTMWHVLEHVPDPLSLLQENHRVLKDDGVMILEVPNFGGLQAKLFGNKWFHLDPPRHLFHFSDKSLRTMLGRSGFVIVDRKNISLQYDVFGFIQNALNGVCFQFDYLYNFLRSKKGRMMREDPWRFTWDLLATVGTGPFLFAVALVVVPVSSLAGMGGILRFTCRKRETR